MRIGKPAGNTTVLKEAPLINTEWQYCDKNDCSSGTRVVRSFFQSTALHRTLLNKSNSRSVQPSHGRAQPHRSISMKDMGMLLGSKSGDY